eukprot:scaffold201383_cov16-Prasinocladus_malaysianus.AAC.1
MANCANGGVDRVDLYRYSYTIMGRKCYAVSARSRHRLQQSGGGRPHHSWLCWYIRDNNGGRMGQWVVQMMMISESCESRNIPAALFKADLCAPPSLSTGAGGV